MVELRGMPAAVGHGSTWTPSRSARVPARRIGGLVAAVAAGLLVTAAVAVFAVRYETFRRLDLVGVDLDIYTFYAERFIATGSMYDPGQLIGPYLGQPYVSGPIPADMPALYPPTAVWLFLPFLVVPAFVWWLIPLGVTTYVVISYRPARWAWPVMAAMLAWPETAAGIIVGNTAMWLVAGVAGGLRWGWPAIIVAIKPLVAPLALVGARDRRWWFGLGAAIVLSVPLVGEWSRYPAVVFNARDANYSAVGTVILMGLPIVAWVARRDHARTINGGSDLASPPSTSGDSAGATSGA